MKLKDLFNRQGLNWTNRDEYELSKGKTDKRSFSKIFMFMPFAVLVTCMVIIISVVGVPTIMNGFASIWASSAEDESLHGSSEVEVLFEDVKPDSKYYDALVYLKKHGIVSGFEDGSFRPYQEMQRASLVKAIVNAKKSFPLALNYNSCFKDVQNQWFAPAVCFAKENGWITGYEDGTFHPMESLTKVESLKMVLDAFEVDLADGSENIDTFEDVEREQWYFPYVQTALKENLIEENPNQEFYEPESPALRGGVSQLIFRVLLL